MVKKYQIVCYVRVEPENPELYDTEEEAENDALNHFSLLQPENKYEVEEVDVEEEKVKNLKKDEKILCKCGHWIRIVGTKWQHINKVCEDTDSEMMRYRESCYECDCINPEPLKLSENIVSDDVYNAM